MNHTTVRAGINFNNPLKIASHPSPSDAKSLLSTFNISGAGAEGLILDTVKRGEDDEDISLGELPKRAGRCVILRIYDSLGGKAKGKVTWGKLPVKKVTKVNVLEDDLEEVSIASGDNSVTIEVKAFEVVTLRLQL